MINGMWVFVILCVFTVLFCAIQMYYYRKNQLQTFYEINEKFKKELYEDLRRKGYDV